jgi:hypothetical protein
VHTGPGIFTVRPSVRARAERAAVLLGVVVVALLGFAAPAFAGGDDGRGDDHGREVHRPDLVEEVRGNLDRLLTSREVLPEQVLQAEAPTLVRALDDDPVLEQLLPFGRNVAIVPLIADGETLGVLLAEWGRGPRAQIPAVTVETRAQPASQTAAVLRNAALLFEIEHLATRTA